jgi:hypothetical protein
MTTTTKIVIGRIRDGMTSSETGSLAKKINDITTGATSYTVKTARTGREVVAVIVYS